jgi:peptidoglycan LD-endopeptidase CwlK
MSLISDTKSIQRICGVEPVDGVFGPVTAAAVLRRLGPETQDGKTQDPAPRGYAEASTRDEMDARTMAAIRSLDAKAQDRFIRFARLAKATAATLGCDYVAICGTRTMEEQDSLHRKSLAGGAHAAAPGFSWHNFGIAVDFGVFKAGGKIYCDDAQPEVADKVHAACAGHAHACGLEWGGTWTGKSNDPPHYQINMGHSIPTAADRAAFREEGSVL